MLIYRNCFCVLNSVCVLLRLILTIRFIKTIDMNLYPAIFIGHGNPMNAIENNEYSNEWELLGAKLPQPKAIVCISAHWTTTETLVTAVDNPKTIHDFYGFPEELYKVQYPSPGNISLAGEIQKHFNGSVQPDYKWGLDHGCWSVLIRMFPKANIPVIQLSLNTRLTPLQHFELGRQLNYLRENNVLLLGSGNIVHNLSRINWHDESFSWATSFDSKVRDKIIARDFVSLCNYQGLGDDALLSVPTSEHYLPMLYILGMINPESTISFFCEKVTMGSISMRSFMVSQ